jgi:hypothetical protein
MVLVAAGSFFPGAASARGTGLAGIGAEACATFAEDDKNLPETADTAAFMWAQGWMSALNQGAESDKYPPANLNVLTEDQQIQVIRAYCAAHPSSKVSDGVAELYRVLTAMPRIPDN